MNNVVPIRSHLDIARQYWADNPPPPMTDTQRAALARLGREMPSLQGVLQAA